MNPISVIFRFIIGFFCAAILLSDLSARAATLDSHTVVLDENGKIIPWTTDPAQGYDRVMSLAWNYLLTGVPIAPLNGKPYYYSYSYFEPTTMAPGSGPHNPAGLYGMLTESALKYFGYSGNIEVVNLAINVATAQLDRGMTPTAWIWPNVPYASGDEGMLDYHGAAVGDTDGTGDGTGVIEPDKVGEMGYAWLQLYRFSGNTRFRDAAISAANALAVHVRSGNATQSPWPFRVYAESGVVREEYCANTIGPIRLFDGLISLGLGNVTSYQAARQTAWNWLMAYPMQNNIWANYFEDVPIQPNTNNVNQYNAMMTARYLLEHPEYDPSWESHVRGLILWVEQKFAVASYGANTITIAEQITFWHPMGSHTSRYASVNAMLYEKTGDAAAREKAYRSLNWSTYMARESGIVIDGPEVNHVWFTDGYGDYVRHFMTSLGAVPEWSPAGQNHLLRSSSVVKSVNYQPNAVNYTTSDGASTEVVRTMFTPAGVTVDGQALGKRSDLNEAGWMFDPVLKVLRVRHDTGTNVQIVSGTLVSIAVTPADQTIYNGSTRQLTATGTYSDGSTQNISSQVSWLSSNTGVASITNDGLATGISAGSTTLSATLNGVTGSTNLTVLIDLIPPSAPTNLIAVATSVTQINLNWTASTDNVGVTRYRVIRNGSQIAISTSTAYSDTTVASGTTYNYTVGAYDAAGNVSENSNTVTVTTPTLPPAPVVDVTVTTRQATGSRTISSPSISTSKTNELLLAFIASDGPDSAGAQWITAVSGGGLTWTLRSRANAQAGTAEIWQAVTSAIVKNMIVTATRATGSYQGMITIAAFQGASMVANGAAANASAASGAPSVTLTTTRANSVVWGVGDDWDRAVVRTVSADQTKHSEYLAPAGDTFWVQYLTAPVAMAGVTATISCTAPTNDRWNLAAIEVVPDSMPSGPDTTPPIVTVFAIPATSGTLTAAINSFIATDNIGVTGYLVNESASIPSSTAGGWAGVPPTSYTFATAGNKTLYAWAKDAAGNVSASLSANIIITLQTTDVEPAGWFAGDMHVHRSCGGTPETVPDMFQKMTPQNLSVISLLADMGNGEVQNPATDLPLVNGQDDSISTSDKILHWDAEWHWDATYSQYPDQALGGHIVALGLSSAHQVWEEYTYPIFDWAHQQNGIAGFVHMQYLDNSIPQSLTCCTPIEYPVEVALGSADFIAEDVQDANSSSGMCPECAIQAYYRLLNCGFRPGFAAGTDYPCNSSNPLGSLLTYVQVTAGDMTYRNWIDGIARGRTVVSRNGHNEFLNLTVNNSATPGDEIKLSTGGTVQVNVQWTANQNFSGTIELVQNGAVVASRQASVSSGVPAGLSAMVDFTKSGWLAARRMGSNGHVVHTGAVFVTIDNAPVRASAADAEFYVQWMDNLLTKTSSGGAWSSYFQTSLDAAQARYQAAKTMYQHIQSEASQQPTLSSISVTPAGASIMIGATQQFYATGNYSDGSTRNITGLTTWASSNTGVATISSTALATSGSAGNSIISATLDGITGSTTLTVQAPPLVITTVSLPGGTQNVPYSTTLAASGGVQPYSWTLSAGSLPAGLSLNSTTGVVSGTPTVAGSSTFTVQVSDAGTPPQVTTKALSILIVTIPPISPAPVLDIFVTTKQSVKGRTISSPAFSTSRTDELLVAFIASDGPGARGSQSITSVTGGGLSWTRRARANAQAGTAEIWQARAANVVTNITVTAARANGSYQGMITVAAFHGASLTTNGAAANASAASGAPTVSLVTTRANSLVWGVGDDWDRAVVRTVSSNQTKLTEFLAPAGDTFWVQYITAPVAAAGTTATISCTAPINDRWNLAAIEIVPP